MSGIRIHRFIAWGAVILWMGLIFFLSHQPGEASSGLSSGVVGLIVRMLTTALPFISFDIHMLHFFVRKFAHFFAYFMLGLLMIHAVLIDRSFSVRTALFVFSLTVIYAISDEVHQVFIPGRSGEVQDVLIDSSGSAVGIGVYMLVYSLFRKGRSTL